MSNHILSEELFHSSMARGHAGTVRKEDEFKGGEIEWEKLKELLKSGIVHFIYIKIPTKNGTKAGVVRDAYGTKNASYYGFSTPPNHLLKKCTNSYYQIYMDIDSENWRLFDETRVIGAEYVTFGEDDVKSMTDEERHERFVKLMTECDYDPDVRIVAPKV